MNTFKNKIIFIVIIVISVLFLYTNLCILYGAIRERNSKVCISPDQKQFSDMAMNIVGEVCVKNADKINEGNQQKLNDCQSQLEKYKYSLYKLKSQSASTTEAAQ